MAIKIYDVCIDKLTTEEIKQYELKNKKARLYLIFQLFVYLVQFLSLFLSLLTGYYYKIKFITTFDWFDELDLEQYEKPLVQIFGAAPIILCVFFIILFFITLKVIKSKEKNLIMKFIKFFFIFLSLFINISFIIFIFWLFIYLPWNFQISLHDFKFSVHKRILHFHEIEFFIKKYCKFFDIEFTEEINKKIHNRLEEKFPNYTKIIVENIISEVKLVKQEIETLAKQEAERKALELQKIFEQQNEFFIFRWFKSALGALGLHREIETKEVLIFISILLSIIGLCSVMNSIKKTKIELNEKECVYDPESYQLIKNTELDISTDFPEEEREFQLILKESMVEEPFEPILNDKILSGEIPRNLRRYISAEWSGTPVRYKMRLWDPWDKMGGVYGGITDEYKIHYPTGSPFFGKDKKEGGIPAEILKGDNMSVLEHIEEQKKGLKMLQEDLAFKIDLQIKLIEKKAKNFMDVQNIKNNNFEIQQLMQEIAVFVTSIDQLNSVLIATQNSLIINETNMEENHPYFDFFEGLHLYRYKNDWPELMHVPCDADDGSLYDKELRPDTWELWRDESLHQTITPKIYTIKYGDTDIYLYKQEVVDQMKKAEEVPILGCKEYNPKEYDFFKEYVKKNHIDDIDDIEEFEGFEDFLGAEWERKKEIQYEESVKAAIYKAYVDSGGFSFDPFS